jgi:hypothetical protein
MGFLKKKTVMTSLPGTTAPQLVVLYSYSYILDFQWHVFCETMNKTNAYIQVLVHGFYIR